MIQSTMQKSFLRKTLAFSAFTVGFVATVAQILLLRENAAAYGNQEIFYGLTLAFWLFYIGWGSRLVRRFEQKNAVGFFLITQMFTIPLLFSSVFLTRTLKSFFGLVSGSIVSPHYIIIFSLLTILPLCLLLGLQFSLISRIFADMYKNIPEQLNAAYLFESFGAVVGGMLFNFVLIFLLTPFQILAILAMLLWASLTLIVCYLIPTKDTGNRKFWGTFALIILFFVCLLLVSPVSSTLEKWSSRKAWQGFQLLKTVESPYGRLTFMQNKREITAFNNSEL
ncbi:hypothetical protein ACFL5G_05885, partial [Candidatus Margulisiibacteriota bacterium]